MKAKKFMKLQETPAAQTLVQRKKVDPETIKYFTEIANVLEGGVGGDLEEWAFICCNALEETNGKELELATDSIISHTLQSLLEGCDVDHLCGFLRGCANEFPSIVMDKSGSHVVETAFKSLAMHLNEDRETYSVIKETLTIICKLVISNPVDVMCNCYGSHVLRSLLCLCKGVSLDSAKFHCRESSTNLEERLNHKSLHLDELNSSHSYEFPDLLKLLMEILKHDKKEIRTLQLNQNSSLVIQTALKLFAEYKEDLLHIIPVVLGCSAKNRADGSFLEMNAMENIKDLMTTTSFCHLMEVILAVAPDALYNEIFTKIFRNSLFEISSHHCGNFAIQALISNANQYQIELIWEELGTKFKDLFGMGRSGVVASLIAVCQRFHVLEQKCCQVLAAAVCPANDSPKKIVPRILFLDSYFYCKDPINWEWPNESKIHVIGSLILQTVYQFPNEFIRPYISSITSLKADHVVSAAKDGSGARVIESFLASNTSEKMKQKVISRLRGHFGELSMQPCGSFVVEKCFAVSNLSVKETIVSELLAVQTELSRTKQGPHLLRALDVDRFAARVDEWRSRQTSKQSVFKKFNAVFGNDENKVCEAGRAFNRSLPPKTVKDARREIQRCLDNSEFSGKKHARKSSEAVAEGKSSRKKKRSGKLIG